MEKVFSHIPESESDKIAEAILNWDDLPGIIAFIGDLGAGKTTLIKKLVKLLGSEDIVSSPTFSLIQEYKFPGNKSIYHADWYRIEDPNELLDSGMLEYVHEAEKLFIEWPQSGLPLLEGEKVLWVKITHQNGSRTYLLSDNPESVFQDL